LNFDDRRLQLFGAWYKTIATRNFSKEAQEKLIGDFDTTKPEEVKTMISHLEQNLKRYYNEALLAGKKEGKLEGFCEGKLKGIREGKLEGIREGEKKGKIETAQTMLRMKLDVNLIAVATGLALDEIEKLKLNI
jgi:predicted transposase/invertase (TIGR01784 family)